MIKGIFFIYFIILQYCIGCTQSKDKYLQSTSNNIINYNNSIIIPEELRKYLSIKFTSFKIPDTLNFVTAWRNFMDSPGLPYYCNSDFNGDGQIDYALILQKENFECDIFVFFRTDNGFHHYLIHKFYLVNSKINVIISIEKKGKWDIIDRTIDVINNAIIVNMIAESLSVAYYWNGNEFVKLLFD